MTLADDTPELQFRYHFFQQELRYARQHHQSRGKTQSSAVGGGGKTQQHSNGARPPMIQLDAQTGQPTGVLTERCLFALEHILYKHAYSVEQVDRLFARGLWECMRRGLTVRVVFPCARHSAHVWM